MTMILRAAVTGVLLVLALPAFAQEADSEAFFPQQMNARQLLLQCSSSSMTASGRERQRYCDGFISGIEESLRLAAPLHAKQLICAPEGVRAKQLSRAFISFANSHQADLVKPAAAVVVDALSSTYPCP
ncbi:hypothetical protein MIB92_01950 [Aestuariirhabdus sp. Z084]|uniref:Rap1a/Tai family immunity protein n=1 Tax=Aestuariirhabdus haliotis TaxID=2918751 RepID=UPI00201B3903|nr:Rap1a/Tai family immunity protein [Aestuariirhabdus haliotis]MCL6414402.1 hypothetical protein [Aestuariirhabdus haliotis]MCL6418334.1 hypothetical protein [Aestuariirhabdus haliotis]